MARKKKTVRRRKGRVPAQLRPYLFKKGHRARRRKNPARKKRRTAGLQVAEQRLTTIKRRRKNPSRSEHSANRQLRRSGWVLIAKGPGGRALRYTGQKFSDHSRPKLYAGLPSARAAAGALRKRYGAVLHRYSLYAAPTMGK